MYDYNINHVISSNNIILLRVLHVSQISWLYVTNDFDRSHLFYNEDQFQILN